MKIKDIILLDVLIDDLKIDEGTRPFIYDDATGEKIDWNRLRAMGAIKGYPTMGIGHNVEARNFTGDIINRLFLEDLNRAINQARESFKFFRTLTLNRRRVIVNMIFNMGLHGVKTFKRMIMAIEQDDYEWASDEMLNSAWARNQQTSHRARKLAELMLIG